MLDKIFLTSAVVFVVSLLLIEPLDKHDKAANIDAVIGAISGVIFLVTGILKIWL
jgi:hypothetical protein